MLKRNQSFKKTYRLILRCDGLIIHTLNGVEALPTQFLIGMRCPIGAVPFYTCPSAHDADWSRKGTRENTSRGVMHACNFPTLQVCVSKSGSKEGCAKSFQNSKNKHCYPTQNFTLNTMRYFVFP